jgi:hypothetical protein
MKEKIREILVDDNCNCLLCKRESAEEITAMDMEFVGWTIDVELKSGVTDIISLTKCYSFGGNDFEYYADLTTVFNYWLTNIYKK